MDRLLVEEHMGQLQAVVLVEQLVELQVVVQEPLVLLVERVVVGSWHMDKLVELELLVQQAELVQVLVLATGTKGMADI